MFYKELNNFYIWVTWVKRSDILEVNSFISIFFVVMLIIIAFSVSYVKPTTVQNTDVEASYVCTSQTYALVLNFTINTTIDEVLAGATPNNGQVLENDNQSIDWGGIGKMWYYDNSSGPSGGGWNASIDCIFLDNMTNNSQYNTGETVLAGLPPSNGTTGTGGGCKNMSSWHRIKSYDAAGGDIWDSYNDSIIFEGTDNNTCYLDEINTVTFNLTSDCNASSSDISDLTLWVENGLAGGFQSSGSNDTLLGNASYSTNSNSWNISSLSQGINTSATFYVAVNISATAIHYHTIKMEIPTLYDANSNGNYDFGDQGIFLAGTNDTGDKTNLYNITIDSYAPESSVDAISDYWHSSQPFTINATAIDNTSGVANVALYWYNSTDNSTWSGPWSNGTDSTAPYSWSFTFSNGSSSYYRFYTIANDNATNIETPPVNNDTKCFFNNTIPTISSNPLPSNVTTYSTGNRPSSLSWSGGDIDNDTVNYTIYLKADNSSFNSSDIAGYSENTTSYSVSLSWSTIYYWKIVATDEHGAIAQGPVWHFTIGSQFSSGGGSPYIPSPTPPEDEGEEGIEPSEQIMEYIKEQYNITLEEKFYANDTNGDGILDTLTDPNDVLTNVNFVNISGNASFLLSINDDEIPEFLWDANAETVIAVNHELGTVVDTEINAEEETITISVNVNKSDWIYIEIIDQFPPEQYLDYILVVKNESGENISSDMIWRENGKIYMLDDPDILYEFVYGYKVLDPTFNPASMETFSTKKPTINITYNEQVEIKTVSFGTLNIKDQFTTTDNLTFIFTSKSDLVNGTYILNITSQDTDGNSLTSTATYGIQVTEEEPADEKQEEEFPWLIIVLIIAIITIIITLFKAGYLYIEK
jgi:hypothetical protein